MTYQVEVPLEGAELLGAKVLGQDGSRELGNICDAECFPRFRPEDDLGMISRCSDKLALALQHLIETTRELLWYSSLAGSRVVQSGDSTGKRCSWEIGGHDRNVVLSLAQ